jgi:DNA-binding transcriptional LysR family regulator
MRFDLVDLQLFVAVADARSITGGALRAHLALASASARIKGLEAALGAALLKRGRRGIELTAAGESLLDHARIILHHVETMRGDLSAYASGARASVHLLANTSGLSEHLPKALAAFLREHPDINVDIEERESTDIAAAIATGAADLGFAAEHALPDNVERFLFSEDRLMLITARRGDLAGRRQIDFQEVRDRDFVGLIPPRFRSISQDMPRGSACACDFGRGCGISTRSARWWRRRSASRWCRKPRRSAAQGRCRSR